MTPSPAHLPDRERPSAPVPVSVVIPAYNRAHMIERAVRSAAEQWPAPPAEILVVDDGSDDDTGRRAAGAGARVITHETNRGEGAARNTGIAAANQPWVALLDSDDEWMPNLLALLWPLRGDHVVVGGGSLNCGADPREDRYNGPTGRRPLVIGSPAVLVYPENFIAASGTMVRRDAMRAAGGYVEGMRAAADMDLWIRLLERGSAIILPRPVVVYHLHQGQVTSDAELMSSAHRAATLRYADRSWWRPRRLELWEGARTYDDLRRSLRDRDPSAAAAHGLALLRAPVRTAGAIGIVARRMRLMRRSGLVDRRGEPATVVLDGPRSVARALLRPPARAIVHSRRSAWLLRLAGGHPVGQGRAGTGRPPPSGTVADAAEDARSP